MTIRVLVVDDHHVVRKGLAGYLQVMDAFELVGEAATGEEALDLCATVMPDVVLMDLEMPGMGGQAATQAIKAQHPNVQVVVLTSYDDGTHVTAALDAGAKGYLLKNADVQQIADALAAAHTGQSVLSPEATAALIHARNEPQIDLKLRERQVLELMAAGLTNPQIAEKLHLSRATIKYYVGEILSKFGAATRTEAVAYALEHRLLD